MPKNLGLGPRCGTSVRDTVSSLKLQRGAVAVACCVRERRRFRAADYLEVPVLRSTKALFGAAAAMTVVVGGWLGGWADIELFEFALSLCLLAGVADFDFLTGPHGKEKPGAPAPATPPPPTHRGVPLLIIITT